jgi:ATP-dependent HslUV protease ATP-binding subunit HslU
MLTPREIVSELNKFIIGQDEAKRMVSIAMRNRWRRQQIAPDLRDEIAPKNIIMIGPTGVGKTEIARRLARLAHAPFHKVEATKFTEVGYVGRDVESMIRELMDIGVNLVRKEELENVRVKAETQAEERLLDLLLPKSGQSRHEPSSGFGYTQPQQPKETGSDDTREKLRKLWRQGKLDDRTVELQTTSQGPSVNIMAIPGMEDMEMQFKDMFSRVLPQDKKTRRMNVREAYDLLIQEESDKLIDMDKVAETAKERVEQGGIIFLDELDKVCGGGKDRQGADVSREGVQRDLLPVVEGSTVNTKYGMIKTDHILFIAAGAFHYSKPSDLVPELQGRFPLRVELSSLGMEEFYRILTEPQNALTKQYRELLATEGVDLDFTEDALREIAEFAQKINGETENIGARRLYTIFEKILSDLSFEAPDMNSQKVVVDAEYVRDKLSDVREDRDLTRYIL